jgi:hypothetical protein
MNEVLDGLRELFAQAGPFATAYLDATRSTESGGREVRLRWSGLREELRRQGADEPTLRALDEVTAARDAAGRHGRVLVGAAGTIVFDELLPAPPLRPGASWSALPDLMPYLSQRLNRGPALAHVVARVDHTGVDIEAVPVVGDGSAQSLQGSRQYPLHKTAANDWSERHFQNRVDNTVEFNARESSLAVAEQAKRVDAEVVIVAGDPRSAASVRDHLRGLLPPSVDVVEVAAGGRADGASEQALRMAVHDHLWRRVWRTRRDVLARLQQDLGRGAYAVAGLNEVVGALQQAQVETVVLSDEPASTLHAWIGPEPLQFATSEDAVHELGVESPRETRLDAALVRAVVGSGADLMITPGGHGYVQDGIAALLRYSSEAAAVSG